MSNFALWPKIRKFKMATIFLKPKILGRGSCKCTLGVENFNEIALSHTVKEMSDFVFGPKIRKFKMATIFQKTKIFAERPLGLKILPKSLYLAPLRRYKQFCVYAENSKIQNGRHFSGD